MFKKLLLVALLFSMAGNAFCQEKQEQKKWNWIKTTTVVAGTIGTCTLISYLMRNRTKLMKVDFSSSGLNDSFVEKYYQEKILTAFMNLSLEEQFEWLVFYCPNDTLKSLAKKDSFYSVISLAKKASREMSLLGGVVLGLFISPYTISLTTNNRDVS
jgi:hypothetical protein